MEVGGRCMVCNSSKQLNNITDLHTKSGIKYIDIIYKCFFIQFLDKNFEKLNKMCKKCITYLECCCDFKRKIELAHQKLYYIVELKANENNASHNQVRGVLSNYTSLNTKCTNLNSKQPTETHSKVINDQETIVKVENTELCIKEEVYNCDDEVSYDTYGNNSDKSDSEWSTNTDDVHTATGYYVEVEKILSRKPYRPPKLSDNCTQCPLCDESVNNRVELIKHYDEHNLKLFLCEICGRLFLRKYSFHVHRTRHDDYKFPCTKCNKVYRLESSRTFHIKHIHLKMRMYSCRQCRISFSEASHRVKHLREVHGETDQYSCEQCEKNFRTKSKLSTHIRRFHLRERNRVCDVCPARFFSKVELKKHALTHTGDKNYHCQYCGKSFGHSQYLAQHVKIHLNIKKYKCECGKAFVQKCSLLAHIKTHHKT